MLNTEADFFPTLALIRRLEALSVRAWMPEQTCYDRTWACRLTPEYPAWCLNCITPLDPTDDENIEERIGKLSFGKMFGGRKLAMRLTPLASPSIKNYCRRKNWRYFSPVLMLFSPLSQIISCLPASNENLEEKETILSPSISIRLKTVSKEFYADVSLQIHNLSFSLRSSFIKILQRIIGRKTFFLGFNKNEVPVANMLVVCENHFAGLLDLAVLRSSCQQKVERMFFLAVLRQLQKMNVSDIWLQVKAENRAALDIYQSFGFVPYYDYGYWISDLL